MRLVRPLRPFFLGASTHGPGDGPFPLDDAQAERLRLQGLVELVVAVAFEPAAGGEATDPAPAQAERAVARPDRARRRR